MFTLWLPNNSGTGLHHLILHTPGVQGRNFLNHRYVTAQSLHQCTAGAQSWVTLLSSNGSFKNCALEVSISENGVCTWEPDHGIQVLVMPVVLSGLFLETKDFLVSVSLSITTRATFPSIWTLYVSGFTFFLGTNTLFSRMVIPRSAQWKGVTGQAPVNKGSQ